MSFEEKIEEAMNDMLADGKMPGLCCLNKHTLTQLAKELDVGERVIGPVGPPVAGMIYFDVDESLQDGEIVIKDVMTPEYASTRLAQKKKEYEKRQKKIFME